eukprot:g17526.t1
MSTADQPSLKTQQDHPITADVHSFQETTGYLKCTKRNLAIHKRANEELFNQFLNSTCIDAPFNKEHQAHSTHTLWQASGRASSCYGAPPPWAAVKAISEPNSPNTVFLQHEQSASKGWFSCISGMKRTARLYVQIICLVAMVAKEIENPPDK